MKDKQFVLSEIQRKIISEAAYISRNNNEEADWPEYLLTTKERRVWTREAFDDASEELLVAADTLRAAQKAVTNATEVLDRAKKAFTVADKSCKEVGGEYSTRQNLADAEQACEEAEKKLTDAQSAWEYADSEHEYATADIDDLPGEETDEEDS